MLQSPAPPGKPIAETEKMALQMVYLSTTLFLYQREQIQPS